MWSWVLDGAELAVRSAALPVILGQRWFGGSGGGTRGGSDAPAATWLLRAKIAADELFFATEFLAGAPFGFLQVGRIAAEVERAVELFGRQGWLEHPETYHAPPPPLDAVESIDTVASGLAYQHVR